MITMPRFGFALAAFCLLVTNSGAGEDRPVDNPKPIALFDGKTLDGWKKTDFSRQAEVKVVDGAIVMAEGGPMSGVVCTRKGLPTTDYELTYEAIRLEGADFFAAATFPVGKSFVTLINGGWGGGVTGLSSLNGADASENDTTRGFEYKNKTWYRFRVRVTDRVIAAWVGDEQVVAVNYKGRQVGTRIETRQCQPLGFATYDTRGAVRKVEVRALTPVEVEATNALAE
jgi:hypothetical protein